MTSKNIEPENPEPDTSDLPLYLTIFIFLVIGLIIYFYKRKKKSKKERHKQLTNAEANETITVICLQNINTSLIINSNSEIKQDWEVVNFYKKERQCYDEIMNLDYLVFPRTRYCRKFIIYDKKLHHKYRNWIGEIYTEKQRAFYSIYLDFIVGLGKHFIIMVSDCLISDIKAFIPKEKKEELLIEVDVLKKELNSMFVDFYLSRQKNLDVETIINAISRYYKVLFAILDTFDRKNETVALNYDILISKYIEIKKICEESKGLFDRLDNNNSIVLFFFTHLNITFKNDIFQYLNLMDLIYKR